ncbi:hypothetical protein [Pantoea sp. A4]|uniref:hypothetical protein n=1 Tax=Pantoea sp. A4 TaxID=1225184 RepID=UPI0008FADAD4|nr:hypothetical protein [Pantoea sp. A4]
MLNVKTDTKITSEYLLKSREEFLTTLGNGKIPLTSECAKWVCSEASRHGMYINHIESGDLVNYTYTPYCYLILSSKDIINNDAKLHHNNNHATCIICSHEEMGCKLFKIKLNKYIEV